MAINFKDWQKNLQEEQLDETPVTKAKQPYRPGSIDPATGKTREAPKGTYAYDKAQREKNKVKEELTGNQDKQLDELSVKTTHNYMKKAKSELENGERPEKYAQRVAGIERAENSMEKKTGTAYPGFVKRTIAKLKKEEVELEEALKGNQHKLDVDKDGKIERSDLKKLRAKKDEIVVNKGEQVRENDNCGKKMYREFVEEMQELAEIAEAKKDDYWDFKDLKDKEKNQPTSRKVAGTRYGGSAQKDEPEDDDNDDKPAVKRGRGRPAGSKSGARTAGNGKSYGGLAIHSLNLPSKK